MIEDRMNENHLSDEEKALMLNRDLMWVVSSPVISGSAPPQFKEWVGRGDWPQVPLALFEFRKAPIGRYFEKLVALWVAHQEGVRNLETNVVIRDGKETLGELDMIFEMGGRCVHWELAVKFYLGTGDGALASDWHGPLGRDRLDLKLAKLNQKQLKLLESDAGKALLKERGFDQAESHALVKGALFYPYDAWQQRNLASNSAINKNHDKGWWVHLSSLSQVATEGRRCRVLSKSDWLSKANGRNLISFKAMSLWLSEYFASDPRPSLIGFFDHAGNETERGFVVPDDWSPSPLLAQ